MIHAVIFDLDDTLYPEVEYCRGGFAAVANELAARGCVATGVADCLLRIHLEEGRDRVFNRAASRLGFPETWVPGLVRAYREHEPSLRMPGDVTEVLAALRPSFRLGCVTDGHAPVQRAKIRALDLGRWLDVIIVADDLGHAYWKPHPASLINCCKALHVSCADAVFVGDNPQRDMAAAANAGMLCIRLRRPGAYFAALEDETNRAFLEITEFKSLLSALGNLVCANATKAVPTAQ